MAHVKGFAEPVALRRVPAIPHSPAIDNEQRTAGDRRDPEPVDRG
jgi:hypothetical protein